MFPDHSKWDSFSETTNQYQLKTDSIYNSIAAEDTDAPCQR